MLIKNIFFVFTGNFFLGLLNYHTQAFRTPVSKRRITTSSHAHIYLSPGWFDIAGGEAEDKGKVKNRNPPHPSDPNNANNSQNSVHLLSFVAFAQSFLPSPFLDVSLSIPLRLGSSSPQHPPTTCPPFLFHHPPSFPDIDIFPPSLRP